MSETETTKKTPRKRAAKKTAKLDAFPRKGGLIDWKQLIPIEYFDLSEDWCAQQGIDKSLMTRDEIEEKLKEVDDSAKLIMLYGFKYVAHLRGLKSVRYEWESKPEDKYAVVLCKLEFVEDSKLGDLTYAEGLANATQLNTTYPFDQYLESIAENRAFIRAVRTALNIEIVGFEEVKEKPARSVDILGEDDSLPLSAQDSLKKLVDGKPNGSFSKLINNLKKKGWENLDDKKDYSDFSTEECLQIIQMIQSK